MKTKKMSVKKHKIAALKFARTLIEDEQEEYICHALNEYATPWYDDPDTKKQKAVAYLKNYIAKNLDAHHDEWYKQYYQGKGLEDWIVAKGYAKDFIECNPKKMIQTRLNWIDWMLECYGEKA